MTAVRQITTRAQRSSRQGNGRFVGSVLFSRFLLSIWTITKFGLCALNKRRQCSVMCRWLISVFPKSALPIGTDDYFATPTWCNALYREMKLTACTWHAIRERNQHHMVCMWPASTLETSKFNIFSQKWTPVFSNFALPIHLNHRVASQLSFFILCAVTWPHNVRTLLKELVQSCALSALRCSRLCLWNSSLTC